MAAIVASQTDGKTRNFFRRTAELGCVRARGAVAVVRDRLRARLLSGSPRGLLWRLSAFSPMEIDGSTAALPRAPAQRKGAS